MTRRPLFGAQALLWVAFFVAPHVTFRADLAWAISCQALVLVTWALIVAVNAGDL